MKVRITWNGQGGELDHTIVRDADDYDTAVTDALIAFVKDNIVSPGDSFTITEE